MPVRTLEHFRASSPYTKPERIIAETPKPLELHPIDQQVRDPAIQIERVAFTPFYKLDVWPSVEGSTIITWQQNRNFTEALHPNTVLQLFYSKFDLAEDSWLLVYEGDIQFKLADTVKRHHGQRMGGAYKLVLKGPLKTYESQPTTLFSKLSFTEYRTALRIIRAENRQLYHKSPGFLLKRKWLGVKCNVCNDLLTDINKRDQCPICLGTSFIGGYFNPIECGMEITAIDANSDKLDDFRGPIDDNPIQGRITSLYSPNQNDVWIDATTSERYRVVGRKTICQQRSVALVYQVQLKHIPASDIIYSAHPNI